jgi:hypothetical protein
MTRITPLLTSLKTLNITYQTPQETLLGTPETLPTSEPGTPQISYTVAEGDLPSFSITPYQKKFIATIVGAGKVVTAATIYYRMKKNGVSVNTSSSSVSANNYYTWNCNFYDVAVGDVLELALWSNQTDSNWDYKALHTRVSRLILFNKPRLLLPCNFAALESRPVLTLGTAQPSSSPAVLYPYNLDLVLPSISAAFLYESLYPKNTYGLFRVNYGDYYYFNGSTSARTSPTYRPYYDRGYVPAQLIMRGLRID